MFQNRHAPVLNGAAGASARCLSVEPGPLQFCKDTGVTPRRFERTTVSAATSWPRIRLHGLDHLSCSHGFGCRGHDGLPRLGSEIVAVEGVPKPDDPRRVKLMPELLR